MTINKIQFASISVGPKAFCAVSSSGWPERYKRSDCEKALCDFLTPLPVDETVSAFVALQESKRSEFPGRKTTWGDVVTYLARIKATKPQLIVGIVGVAFWGFSLIVESEGHGTN